MTQKGYYTPKLQKRTLKGHSGPVLCLAHSSERLVVRDHHPWRNSRSQRRRPIDESTAATTTTTTTTFAFDDDAEHVKNSYDRLPSSSSVDNNVNNHPNHHHHYNHYHPSLLLSGSEDGTVRLWDLRTRKTSVCIHMPSAENSSDSGRGGTEVTSVSFYPLWDDDIIDDDGDDDFDSSSDVDVRGDSNEYTIYASTSNFVYGYDLRLYHHHQQQHRKQCSRSNSSSNPSSSTTMRIIQGPAHFDLTPLFQCTDEINQLSFTLRSNVTAANFGASAASGGRDGRYDVLLSAADDCGEVHIIENPPSRCKNTFHKEYIMMSDDRMKPTILCHAEPQTLGIASCASFQPISSAKATISSSSSLLLATGGTDCTVKLWDVSKNASPISQRRKNRNEHQPLQQKPRLPKQQPPHRPTCSITISPYETGGGDNGGKLWNPPYIHSLSWSASGKLLAAGVGDGSVVVYRVEGKKTLTEIGRLGRDTENGCTNNHHDVDVHDDDEEARAGHASAVASVRFANFGSGVRGGVVLVNDEEDDRLLLSAGNDGTIIFWDLGGNMVGRDPLDPMQYLLRTRTSPASDGSCGSGGGGSECLQSLDSNIDRDDFTPSPPRVLFKIAHRHKPNWMTCSPFDNDTTAACLPGTIFVADVTKDISAYTLQ